jgi:hypothetical protein
MFIYFANFNRHTTPTNRCLILQELQLLFCVELNTCVFTFWLWVPYCDVRNNFRIKRCSVRHYLRFFVEGLMSCLRYLYLFAHSDVQHIVLCFCLFPFVLCALCWWSEHRFHAEIVVWIKNNTKQAIKVHLNVIGKMKKNVFFKTVFWSLILFN